MNPDVKRQLEVSHAQSESQKMCRENEPLRKFIPRVRVPHYWRMRLTTKK